MVHFLAIPFPQWLTEFDLGINNYVQTLRNPVLDGIFTVITRLGDEGIIWIAIAVLLLCFRKTRKIGITMGIALLLGMILGNEILKKIFERPRPFHTEGAVLAADQLLIPEPGQFSFPSGHTTSSFAAAVSIFVYNKKWGIPALILAVLIAFSRIYVYVHFPTDILAGTILGIFCALVAAFAWRKYLDALVVKGWNKLFKNHTIDHV